jgi:orotate phosphoribosyltransferase
MAAIFTYGFDVAEKEKHNIDLYTLSNYQNLLNLVAKLYLRKEEKL